ncbi:UNVERIFIED_CONTAM: hypothetical protein NCL1_32973 [Trichonephila clavipes]
MSHLGEHNSIAFTARVTLPGEKYCKVFHPYRQVHDFGATNRTWRSSTSSIPQALFILSMTAGLILTVIDIKLKNPHIAITVTAGLLFVVGLVGCCYVKIADVK